MANNVGQANLKSRVNNLLTDLKKKVKNFTVFDRQGQRVGEVQDLVVDVNHQLNLIISKQANQSTLEYSHKLGNQDFLFRLQSQRIKKIDKPTKSVFIDLDHLEIELMPEYLGTETPGDQKLSGNSAEQTLYSQTINNQVESVNLADIGEEKIIRLLEERLTVETGKRKVGEVIVRKEIETRMIQVPIRREKLIVEQISPEHKQLAEIDLGQEEISSIELTEAERLETTNFGGLTVTGEFNSPKIASLLLNAIALERNHGCKQIRVTIAVEDESRQKKYQEWFDRCSKGQQPKSEK
jgi:stress response protein YsnF